MLHFVKPEDEPRRSLDDHLRAVMRESHLNLGRETEALAALREALAADPDLAGQARAKLASLTQGILDRDHISRWFQDTLTRALPPEE